MCLLVMGLWSWSYGESDTPNLSSARPQEVFHHPKPRLLDGFGMSVSLHQDQVLVGAPNAGYPGAETGQAYLFDEQGQLLRTFHMPVVLSGALFGQAVALSEQSVIVGAPHGPDELHTQHGAVYIFDRLSKSPRLTLPNPHPISGVFGHALATEKGRILVGDPQASTPKTYQSGAVYLFDETTGVLKHTFRPEIEKAKRSTRFGHAVALVGSHVVVSAPFGGTIGSESGIVYLFHEQTGKVLQTFEPPISNPSLLFGWAFAVNDRFILIGAFGFQGAYREEGIAYLYEIQSGKLLNTIKNPLPGERARFGKSVAFFNGWLAIGAPGDRILETGKIEGGAVHLFHQLTGTWLMTLREPIPMTGASDIFGDSLFSDGNRLLVGVPFGGKGKELDAGLVYRFANLTIPSSSSISEPVTTLP